MANCHNCERLVICPWASPEEIICSSFKAKPITKADRIRAMSDEELADEILDLFAAFYEVEWSYETLLNWLRQEAE